MASLSFDRRYHERARIADGREVRLRLVRPDDKPLFVEALRRLSPESRYARFLAAKSELSPAELRYLTEVDGHDHFALGATTGHGRTRRGLGVARFVRVADDPDVAEAAIVVVDDAQGKGLGKLLLARLVAAARERGIARFRCDVLATNERMRNLLHELAPGSRDRLEGSLVTVDVPLLDIAANTPPQTWPGPMYQLFARVAEGALRVRSLFGG